MPWKITLKKPTISVSLEDKGIRIRITTYLPLKKYPPKKYPKNAKYVTIHIGLPREIIKALKKFSRKIHKLQSRVIQEAIDFYFIEMEVENLSCEPLKKKQILGLKTIARTIRIDQDTKLRLLAERTGRSISELAREVIIRFLKMRDVLE